MTKSSPIGRMGGLRSGNAPCIIPLTVAAFAALALFNAAPQKVKGAIHYVNPGEIIQTAIDTAEPNDTILVYAGTYPENINFNGKDIILKSDAGPEQTIIEGQGGVFISGVVTFRSGETNNAVLEGFTITSPNYLYSGIYCRNSSPIIKDNIITENFNNSYGGGIFCKYAHPLIISNKS